jgi:outer membrane lipoprotein carrier protein
MAAVKYWFRTAIDLAVLAALAGVAWSDPGPEDAFGADRAALVERLQALAEYTATFNQSVYGVRGEVLEHSQGRVWLERPRFKWVVDDPYPQTLLIDGERLQLYDPDLEQLTVRSLDEALKDTPVSLLTSESVALSDDFRIMRIGDDAGDSFVVEPTSDDTLYREIVLHFDENGLSGLDILDHLGQRTEVRFAPDPESLPIDAATFTLDVPPGTDILGG